MKTQTLQYSIVKYCIIESSIKTHIFKSISMQIIASLRTLYALKAREQARERDREREPERNKMRETERERRKESTRASEQESEQSRKREQD